MRAWSGRDDEVDRGETELLGSCDIAPPIDEGANKTVIAVMLVGAADPGSVEGPELGITHLAAGHHKFAVHSAGHVSGNRHAVGLVGQDQPRPLSSHENCESAGMVESLQMMRWTPTARTSPSWATGLHPPPAPMRQGECDEAPPALRFGH
jgi:hypothetical protein